MATEKHLLLVLTNAVEGREEEFNEWYNDRHLDDVLQVPGIVAAQRYKLSAAQRMTPPFPWTYFAIYEIETDDLPNTISTLSSRSGTAIMPLSNGMHPERQAFVLKAIENGKRAL
ncbi:MULTISPECIES: DUF4286 family protein [unclassified Chelatococcus]|uniref:DUF4286 family protein n=1 Tax=unclassified Chelatococcus TaxID=2638111 RepID=UPI001BD0B2E9|nr:MULTISPECIES: DUF4286 family protein [unclassified Chelatococcus]MBS7743437.1 hypothetical protein [Chelatococcus sp. HY11]MBX3547186.1 hypothetical protein [Chelatococcus sp.]CAH1663837.1 conserved hypothetical protein [Hyphomicrobiales bacterium]CAH1687929.1 conserved hypothetical protein [Hyphomicrobiales bacterium]